MSTHQNHLAQSHDEEIPRLEPWLWVLASSVIPVILALYAHSGFVIPSIAATVVLFLTGLVMLRRDTVRRRREEQRRPLPATRSVARSRDGEPLEMEGAEP
jgi:hypothetical protein